MHKSKIKHSQWATPIVPVVKQNGTIQLCRDHQIIINQASKVDTYPLPKVIGRSVRYHVRGKLFTFKCKLLHLGHSIPYFTYHINLKKVSELKNLGVVIDNKIKFHSQTALVDSQSVYKEIPDLLKPPCMHANAYTFSTL